MSDLILLSGGPLDGKRVPRPDSRSLLVEMSWTSMLARYRQTRHRDVYRFIEYDRRVPTSAPVTPEITDEMVERAARALAREAGEEFVFEGQDARDPIVCAGYRESARKALTAALQREAVA